MNHAPWDIQAIRGHFGFPEQGRVVTNNAASTQPPRELLQLYHELAPDYDNVHRGQSDASQITTARFEAAYDTIAGFVNAPSRRNVVVVPQHHRGAQRGHVLAADASSATATTW